MWHGRPGPTFLISALFCAALAFLNQYTTLLTSSGFRPRRDSRLFSSFTYCCICCRVGCWFSANHLCNFGSSNSGSKLVLILVFCVGNWLCTVCMAGWALSASILSCFGGCGGLVYWGYCSPMLDRATGDWAPYWAAHHCSNLRRRSSDISGVGAPIPEVPRQICDKTSCNNQRFLLVRGFQITRVKVSDAITSGLYKLTWMDN